MRKSDGTSVTASSSAIIGSANERYVAQAYRDLLGRANQTLAAQAEAVYFMVAGLPVDVKALASPALLQSPGPYHTP